MNLFLKGLALGLVLIPACGILFVRAPKGVETDLLQLAEARTGGVLHDLSRGLSGQGRILLEGADFEPLERTAAEIAERFGAKPAGDVRAMLRTLAPHTAGLLAPSTRALLLDGKYREVAETAAARLFGLAPPLFSVRNDPFLLATDWAESLQQKLAPGWSLRGGYPVREEGGRLFLLMTLDLAKVRAAELVTFLDACAARNAGATDVKIWCGGAPFHAARASERSKREVGLLSTLSLILVLALGGMLFRSLRFVPELLVAQGVGFLVAAGTLFAVFPRPHILTFVFGTSLIGLSVDYVYHARATGNVHKILRPLTLSLVTTLACFAPLCCAEVSVLRQMAVFTMSGLVAVYGVVVLWGETPPLRIGARGRTSPGGRIGTIGILLVSVLGALGLPRLQLVEDPAAFYKPDPALLTSERKLMEVRPGQANRFAFVAGATLQEALENEEAAGIAGLSAVIPSLKRQRENAALVARLVAAEGSNYTARTGLRMPASAGGFLDPNDLPEGPLAQMVRSLHVQGGLISPLVGDSPRVTAEGDSPLAIIEPRRALQDLFHTFTQSALRLLVVSFLAFAALLAVLLRGSCLRIAAPVVGALAATAGVLGWCGVPLTFFTLLCFFVLAGLGIDYAIFHDAAAARAARGEDVAETRRTVFFSFLTSFAGLGLLAVTEFPVTRSMGITFASGLAFAYFLSRCVCRGRAAPDPARSWHDQREQSAGRWRLLFMWGVYRLLGKNALKIFCVPVMAFIYPFARPARRALRTFYTILAQVRSLPPSSEAVAENVDADNGNFATASSVTLFRHLLGFAWSLVDKTDACTRRKNLPKMSVVDDADGRAFRELVANRKGCFLISSHLGTIEVLPALASEWTGDVPRVHAFQQMGHDAVFTRLFLKHFDAGTFALHAVEEIGVETAVEMQAAIARGELVLMAGDRVSAGSGKTVTQTFLGRSCRWPKGVFAFAKLMEAPVFFVTCVRTGWNAYTCRFRRFDAADGAGSVVTRLVAQYAAFLEEETRRHPDQWYQFYDFFAEDGTGEDRAAMAKPRFCNSQLSTLNSRLLC